MIKTKKKKCGEGFVFDLNRFLSELDHIYNEAPEKLEGFLKSGLEAARYCADPGSVLVILNELMGYYRVMSCFEDCERTIEEARRTADEMGLQGTVNYAVMLLNIGTAWRVMERYEEAEGCYEQAALILNREITAPDYRMATLYNNRSILYANTGRLAEAKGDLESAMKLIRMLEESETEVAITHVNLGNICFGMQDTDEGLEHMEVAVRIFEREEGRKDSHYASALSGMGEAYFRMNRLEESAACYERALEEIRSNYGENEYYRVTQKNLELVRDTMRRIEAVRGRKIKGMELAKAYYEKYGRPMLREKYGAYAGRIAAGLVGEGSECMGYDDEYSTDHDYGPGFCLWLTPEDYQEIGAALQKDYENLPGEFMGFPARNTTEQGNFRVGVFSIDTFFWRYTGYEEAPDAGTPSGLAAWNKIERSSLRTVTNGQIFEDPLGEFTKRREAFLAYPEELRLRRLAAELGRMAQAGQYNYGRMRKRKDAGAAWLCKYQFIDAALEAAYLLNRLYPPFYKWKMRGMEDFETMKELREQLTELAGMTPDMEAEGSDEAEQMIETVCRDFVRELNRQGMTESRETFLEAQKAELMKKAGLHGKSGK